MQKDPIQEGISRLISEALENLKKEFASLDTSAIQIHLEVPKDRAHGDLFTNVAMRLASLLKQKPLDIAGRLSSELESSLGAGKLTALIKKVEVKAPGFINFWLSDEALCAMLKDIAGLKQDFGKNNIGQGKKVLVEFVSANPTGPLTIAHARQAAFGDSLSKIMTHCGYAVKKEYYINDEGVQMSLLAESVKARYMELHNKKYAFPENGYKGAYIYDIAKDIKEELTDKEFFLKFSCEWIMKGIKKDLDDFNVGFDSWYSQAALAKSGKIEKALALLKEKGYIYENEGASWLKSTDFGDEKDRVVIKSDSSYTYLAPDIAYHRDKFGRGFEKLIDIWGPDHHGYIPRIKAAVTALGFPKDSLSVIIIQLATLFRDGKPVSMSTRQGEFVTLREMLDEVGKDAGRFMFLMRKADSHLDFDLELAKKHTAQNPVYYVQYAHARICSILEKQKPAAAAKTSLTLLREREEVDFIRILSQFPYVVKMCGIGLEPLGLVSYLQELAGAFHYFYDKHRVISDDADITNARLFLVNCAKIVLANGLTLLGVSAPEKM
ncbi:MAG: arginine--tRNA ligase [Candidatus Omnitrophica bacterium]|nr:arginine--tRNA ligase [Candidatus Omnitrophota bacterium]